MGVRSVAWVLVFAMGRVAVGQVQVVHPVEPMPSFEVATIKPASKTPVRFAPAGANAVHYSDITAMDLVAVGFGILSEGRIIGGPGWASSEHYSLDARIDEDLARKIQAMPREEAKKERSLMMQSLLAERFKLKAHFETRVLPVYELVVAKGGSKLKEAKPESAADQAKPLPANASAEQILAHLHRGGYTMRSNKANAEWLAKGFGMDDDNMLLVMEQFVGYRTVVNRTGLKGLYDIVLDWSGPESADANVSGARPALSAGDSDVAPDIFTALQEQLGLKLVPGKAPVEVVVIDQMERPSEN